MKIVVSITGASGSIYALRLIEQLSILSEIEHVAVVFTSSGRQVFNYELTANAFAGLEQLPKVDIIPNDNFFSPIVSGSAAYDAMVVVPCSMGMLGRLSSAISNDVATRAADVMLKERRRLILVTRETPLNLIHIENMRTLTLAGAILQPASPSFYNFPQSVEDMVQTITDRTLSLLGLPNKSKGWG